MPEQLLERPDLEEVPNPPQEDLLVMRGRSAGEAEKRPDSFVPEGLDTVLYEHDERAARADLRRQIAAMELALARLFASAFPRTGIDFAVAGIGGPRLLSVDELEQVRDGLAARIQEVKADLHDYAVAEQGNRELIERMTADPASYKWVRVYNEDIGEPGCKNWHAKPKWGPLGMLMGWWRVKISSGCPLATGPRPPEPPMTTKRQRRKRRRRAAPGGGPSAGSRATGTDSVPRQAARRRSTRRGSVSIGTGGADPAGRPSAPWGDFPLSEIVVFVGILLLIAGFFVSPPQGFVMIAVGLALGSLAGLELSIREHFAGYRSHTLLLSAAVGVPVFGALFILTKVPTPICIAVGLLAFGGSAWLFAQAFRRRSGGALLRIRG